MPAATPTPTSQGQPSLKLDPPSGAPGDLITVTGINFPVDDPLWLMVIHRPGIASEVPWATAEAGPGGSLSVEFVVPAMPSGRYTFLLHTANTLVNAETQFTVTGGLAVTPRPTVPPPPTPPPPGPPLHPALAGYSPLFASVVSAMPARYDFFSDGLSAREKEVMDWADSRLFSNGNFLESRWGPEKWPTDAWTASFQALPLLMLEIDIQKKSNGKHVVSWEADSLNRILDGLGIYEGVCTSCYGKNDYRTREEVRKNYDPFLKDPGHIHREMLKIFAYYAMADGEGVLVRSFMENDAEDLDSLYKRDPASTGFSKSITHTSFGRSNLSFMSQVKLQDGTIKSFPTMVYEIISDADGERDAAERWFGHINRELVHFTGDEDDFANLFRPHSQTPYTPEPGYILIVGEAGSPSSTGLTVSAFRLLGIKAEQLLSPEEGYRTGAVEIDGEWYHHDGNTPLGRRVFPMCAYFLTLYELDTHDINPDCLEQLLAGQAARK